MIILFYLIFSVGVTIAQNKVEERKYSARRDVVIKDTEFGSVYITEDTSFNEYNWFESNFSYVDELDKSIFDSIRMKHLNLLGLHSKWSPIYTYQNKWYVYSPSDWMSSRNLLFTDSLIYYVGSDMFWSDLNEVKIIDSSNFELIYPDFQNQMGKIQIIYLNKIQNNIAEISTYDNQNQRVSSFFMVHTEDVRKYPMIVNECFSMEGNEYFPMKCGQEFEF